MGRKNYSGGGRRVRLDVDPALKVTRDKSNKKIEGNTITRVDVSNVSSNSRSYGSMETMKRAYLSIHHMSCNSRNVCRKVFYPRLFDWRPKKKTKKLEGNAVALFGVKCSLIMK